MFEHKGVHQCTWHQDTLGRRSMIDFVVVSSDLRPYVLDTRVKRGAELSTDHHLVVRFRGRLETLSPEWTCSCSLPPLSTRSSSKLWTQGLWCLCRGGKSPNPVVDTGSKGCCHVRLKKESYRTMLACGTPDAVDRYRQAKQAAAQTVLEAKTQVWEEFCAGGELLTSTEDIVGRWKKYFEDLLNPTDLPSNEEAEDGDSEVDSSITQAEVTEVVQQAPRWQGAGGG
ncbi:hypothetical protein L3Q82_020995 [Scortum barcoo]|uniref:Uncharacterized protein n=1 Tax=Scortum barcoo TaxID=214431 RepID=A0ACB8V9J2_9TELE|nr:hypothetical protein L3Q82_020995 [Scortum barcoo]